VIFRRLAWKVKGAGRTTGKNERKKQLTMNDLNERWTHQYVPLHQLKGVTPVPISSRVKGKRIRSRMGRPETKSRDGNEQKNRRKISVGTKPRKVKGTWSRNSPRGGEMGVDRLRKQETDKRV